MNKIPNKRQISLFKRRKSPPKAIFLLGKVIEFFSLFPLFLIRATLSIFEHDFIHFYFSFLFFSLPRSLDCILDSAECEEETKTKWRLGELMRGEHNENYNQIWIKWNKECCAKTFLMLDYK